MKEGVCHDIIDTGPGTHPLFVGTHFLLHRVHGSLLSFLSHAPEFPLINIPRLIICIKIKVFPKYLTT